MLIYLDAKDIINLLERSCPCSPDDFQKILRAGDHQLVLSCWNFLEIAAPLGEGKPAIGIINRLEGMPRRSIGVIIQKELKAAVDAFEQGREYESIDPFVARFDDTLTVDWTVPTRRLIGVKLIEVAFWLWQDTPKNFQITEKFTTAFQRLFSADRALAETPPLEVHFQTVIQRYRARYKLRPPSAGIQLLADWIYQNPKRCPSVRLVYEMYHKILKNRGYVPDNSDIADLHHISCLPYVDLMTMDVRSLEYLRQVSSNLGIPYIDQVFKDMKDVLAS